MTSYPAAVPLFLDHMRSNYEYSRCLSPRSGSNSCGSSSDGGCRRRRRRTPMTIDNKKQRPPLLEAASIVTALAVAMHRNISDGRQGVANAAEFGWRNCNNRRPLHVSLSPGACSAVQTLRCGGRKGSGPSDSNWRPPPPPLPAHWRPPPPPPPPPSQESLLDEMSLPHRRGHLNTRKYDRSNDTHPVDMNDAGNDKIMHSHSSSMQEGYQLTPPPPPPAVPPVSKLQLPPPPPPPPPPQSPRDKMPLPHRTGHNNHNRKYERLGTNPVDMNDAGNDEIVQEGYLYQSTAQSSMIPPPPPLPSPPVSLVSPQVDKRISLEEYTQHIAQMALTDADIYSDEEEEDDKRHWKHREPSGFLPEEEEENDGKIMLAVEGCETNVEFLRHLVRDELSKMTVDIDVAGSRRREDVQPFSPEAKMQAYASGRTKASWNHAKDSVDTFPEDFFESDFIDVDILKSLDDVGLSESESQYEEAAHYFRDREDGCPESLPQQRGTSHIGSHDNDYIDEEVMQCFDAEYDYSESNEAEVRNLLKPPQAAYFEDLKGSKLSGLSLSSSNVLGLPGMRSLAHSQKQCPSGRENARKELDRRVILQVDSVDFSVACRNAAKALRDSSINGAKYCLPEIITKVSSSRKRNKPRDTTVRARARKAFLSSLNADDISSKTEQELDSIIARLTHGNEKNAIESSIESDNEFADGKEDTHSTLYRVEADAAAVAHNLANQMRKQLSAVYFPPKQLSPDRNCSEYSYDYEYDLLTEED